MRYSYLLCFMVAASCKAMDREIVLSFNNVSYPTIPSVGAAPGNCIKDVKDHPLEMNIQNNQPISLEHVRSFVEGIKLNLIDDETQQAFITKVAEQTEPLLLMHFENINTKSQLDAIKKLEQKLSSPEKIDKTKYTKIQQCLLLLQKNCIEECAWHQYNELEFLLKTKGLSLSKKNGLGNPLLHRIHSEDPFYLRYATQEDFNVTNAEGQTVEQYTLSEVKHACRSIGIIINNNKIQRHINKYYHIVKRRQEVELLEKLFANDQIINNLDVFVQSVFFGVLTLTLQDAHGDTLLHHWAQCNVNLLKKLVDPYAKTSSIKKQLQNALTIKNHNDLTPADIIQQKMQEIIAQPTLDNDNWEKHKNCLNWIKKITG